MDPAGDSRSGPGPQLGDSLRLLLQETTVFKQQNPGKVDLLASWPPGLLAQELLSGSSLLL